MPGCTGDLEKDARFTRSSKWGIVCFVAAALCLIGGDRWSVPILSQAGVLLLGGVFIFLGLDSISTRTHTTGRGGRYATDTYSGLHGVLWGGVFLGTLLLRFRVF